MAHNSRPVNIVSPAFQSGARLDDRFTKRGGNIQPPLRIAGVPRETVELAIVCHDPDAPLPFGFTHWLLYAIPPETGEIGENEGDSSFRPGRNGFGEPGYGGPQPPPGDGPHHYYFWLYALDTAVEGTPDRLEFLEQYGEHIIGQARTIGVYEA